MNQNTVGDLIRELSRFKGCRFVASTYQTKETGEVQDVTIATGFSTRSLYVRDVVTLRRLIRSLTGIPREVAQELLTSRMTSLTDGIGNNPAYTQAETWIYVPGLNGLRIHKETGSVQVMGLVVRKTVLQPGTYKPDTRRPRTKEKDAIRRQLPSHRFRTYSLENVGTVRLNGDVLEIRSL